MSPSRQHGRGESSHEAMDCLRRHIAEHAGLALSEWVLEARVQDRVEALGLASWEAYVELVTSRRGQDELDELIEALRVGETRFFRHAAHVEALVHAVIPELRERKKGRVYQHVRAWSAGCASGEEAYTLAMVLHELLPAPQFKVSVLATDVSARAIEVARRGEYPASSLAHVPGRWRDVAFTPVSSPSMSLPMSSSMSPPVSPLGAGKAGDPAGAMRYRVVPEIARLVRFERQNLLQGPYPTGFDIIWCRNVFIYFTPEARQRVLSRLLSSLSNDGVLFVGYSESLREMSEVESVRTPHAVIYRRPLHALPEARPATLLPAGRGQSQDERATETPGQEHVLRLSGRYEGGDRLAAELAVIMRRAPGRVIMDLDGAELMNDEAAAALRRAMSQAQVMGVDIVLRAGRPGPRRWLRRHGFAPAEAARSTSQGESSAPGRRGDSQGGRS